MSIVSMMNRELYLMGAVHENRASGMICALVMSTTLASGYERVSVACSKANLTTTLALQSGVFTLQLLAEDQGDLIPRFGLASGQSTDKWTGLDIDHSPSGIPMVKGTCGWIECTIHDQLDVGDRVLVSAYVGAGSKVEVVKPMDRTVAIPQLSAAERRRLKDKRIGDAARDAEVLARAGFVPREVS